MIMADHNARIQRQHVDILENIEIDRLEKSIQPIVIMLVVALVAFAADFTLGLYAAKKYASEISTADAFVQCLNGVPIDTGEGVITCPISKIQLVAGIEK